MTRTLCTRSTQRKQKKCSQEIIPDDCKENSPSILSQATIKKQSSKEISSPTLKENKSPSRSAKLLKSVKELRSPLRKSKRCFKSSSTGKNTSFQTQPERSVLCDKTNSQSTLGSCTNSQSSGLTPTTLVENKTKVLYSLCTTSKTNTSGIKVNNQHHVPVYKATDLLDMTSQSSTSQSDKKEAIYEFEVDENEEPVQKKKRKKRIYTRKPKIGPKALTINNIKYSSTESLVSLPEKPIAHKKTTKKPSLKPYSSVTNLNESQDTCYSVQSFMSHPPSLLRCPNKNLRSNFDLSVLQETQSEEYQSPASSLDIPASHSHTLTSAQQNVLTQPPRYSIAKLNNQITCNIDGNSSMAQVISQGNDPIGNISSYNHFSPNPRCYASKSFHSSNSNNTILQQVGSCSPNISTTSSRDFLSSTPCKRISQVVCDNSVFDDSYDNIPETLRPSTGFIKSIVGKVKEDNYDSCFGFDEPEELEEPLVSPIKRNIDLERRKITKYLPRQFRFIQQESDPSKPRISEVIQMLKSSLPKKAKKEPTEVFDNSTSSSSLSVVEEEEKELNTTFKKPPRRSYERQRRIRRNSDHYEEEEEEAKENCDENKENVPQTVKKCYKKINTTKTAKCKVSKAKQKIAKEEEEMERLAALMNAQFQEIEKVDLVVE